MGCDLTQTVRLSQLSRRASTESGGGRVPCCTTKGRRGSHTGSTDLIKEPYARVSL